MIVSFFCPGPADSPFSIPCVQLTDSFHVAVRVDENIAKIERILEIYSKIDDIPEVLFKVLERKKNILKETASEFGSSVSPVC